MTDEQRAGLDVALNESSWLGIDVDVSNSCVSVSVEVLTLPADGPPPEDATFVLILEGVSRVAASLRQGRWNDVDAVVDPVALADLDAVVRSFVGTAMYGWEFVDPPEESWRAWQHRLSLDAQLSSDVAPHVLELFQESVVGPPRHLDLRVWFRALHVARRNGETVPLQQFIAGGFRWWDGMYNGDPRTSGKGIIRG